MLARRPFNDIADLSSAAEEIWNGLGPSDWKEAFSHHPKIGDIGSLRKKFASTGQWAEGEQSGVRQASEETLQALARGNEEYEKKFGYIFIICATGKSATEMNVLLQERLPHSPDVELRVAADEQGKIIRLRIEKLLTEESE